MLAFRRIFSSSNDDISKEMNENLHEIKDLGKAPGDLDFHKMCSLPQQNTIITLNDLTLTVWNMKSVKKQSVYPVPRLVFSSQNLTFIKELKLLIVTLRSNEASIFSLTKRPKLLCKSPVALPYTEYIHQLGIVISFGKDMLSIWGIYNRKVYCRTKGSFHKVKYLKGLNKLATFEGLFCEMNVYDIDENTKTLKNCKRLYTNDSSFGCLNEIEWVEKKNLLIVTDSVVGAVKMYGYRDCRKWQEIRTFEKDAILSQIIRLSNETILLTWGDKNQENSYIIELNKMKLQRLGQTVPKICLYSEPKKTFVACKEGQLSLWKF